MFKSVLHLDRLAITSAIAIGAAVALSSVGIVNAAHVRRANSVTYDCSSGTACVEGDSTGYKTAGIEGVGKDGIGVSGITSSTDGKAAIKGLAFGNGGSPTAGVEGESYNGYGVLGESELDEYPGVLGINLDSSSKESVGVLGFSQKGWGVWGNTDSYIGVVGTTSGPEVSAGVYGSAEKGSGVVGSSEGSAAVTAEAKGASTDIFVGYDGSNECIIDAEADLSCTGSIQGSSLRLRHRNGSGDHVLTYAAESTTATIEDVGTARMVGGIANVQIDPAFISVMDHRWYYVFLTPLGDTRGLYVSMKTASAFQVRETEHGRSNLEFDYRIVARPSDATNDRLPIAPIMKRPVVIQPAR